MMYKIVDYVDGEVRTLFHGINGSKAIPVETWIKADKKWSYDGSKGTQYLTGWHVIPTYDECLDYLRRFTNTEHKAIVACEVRGEVRPKSHSRHNVFLADEIKITMSGK